MAYFNYFIRCIIRNIAYKLCKPKVFLTVLLSVIVLFGLKHYGFCSDMQLDTIIDQLSQVTENQAFISEELGNMGINVNNINVQINNIRNDLANIRSDTSNINDKINVLTTKVENLSTSVNNIILTMEENNEELKNTYIQENNKTVEKLNQIYDYLYGSSTESDGSYSSISGEIYANGNIGGSSWISTGYMQYNPKYRYKLVFTANYDPSTAFTINISGSDVVPYVGLHTELIQSYGLSGGHTYTYIVDSGLDYKFINFSYFSSMGISIAIIEDTPGALGGIQNGLDKGNQLQEESNQLQQDQNDFLKDDNISVDSSSLPSDTSQDITEDGFNSIFQQIYDTFTGGAAQDIVITIPFTNKSFTINANTVYGGANLGFIRTLIEAFWYFVISYFIVQDIGKKINKIKSGDIEHVQEDNIKEDLL